MKYLITGGAGFIGSNLVDYLIFKNNEVVVIDNESSHSKKFFWNNKANNYRYNICDYTMCSDVFNRTRPDVVIHLAAESNVQLSIDDPTLTLETNIIGTANILNLSSRYNVKRVICSSSSSVYGSNDKILDETMTADCLSPYALSKMTLENLCKLYYHLYGLETTCLRYFNVYGDRQPSSGQYRPVMSIFLDQLKNDKKLTIYGDGEQTRDFVHVSDVVQANFLASIFNANDYENTHGRKYDWGQSYNVGSGKSYTINDIAKKFKSDIIYLPKRKGEIIKSSANIEKIKKDLNWYPKVDVIDWIDAILL
jgi:nucleoside-diphosphate-sugar epimerase